MFQYYSHTIIRERINLFLLKLQLLTTVAAVSFIHQLMH